jgi:hypothetical protein
MGLFDQNGFLQNILRRKEITFSSFLNYFLKSYHVWQLKISDAFVTSLMADPVLSLSVGMVDRGEKGLEQVICMRSCRGAAATNIDVDKNYSSI